MRALLLQPNILAATQQEESYIEKNQWWVEQLRPIVSHFKWWVVKKVKIEWKPNMQAAKFETKSYL